MFVDIYLYNKINNEYSILLLFKLKNSHLFASFFDFIPSVVIKSSVF